MAKQSLLYSITLNGQKTYILAALDNPVVGINLLRPNHWETYVSDVFHLSNPREIVTLFSLQNTYQQYDPHTHRVTPAGFNSYHLSSSDTSSIILREAIAAQAQNHDYDFNHIMSRTSYFSLMIHHIASQIFLIISIKKNFLNNITFRSWDRFTKTCSLGLSLLSETPIVKAIKIGVKFARKVVTPHILQTTFFAKAYRFLSSVMHFESLRANFPLASAAAQFFLSSALYEYAFVPLLVFLLASPMIPTPVQIAAPALTVLSLKVGIAFMASYYAARVAIRAFSAAALVIGAEQPVDEHLVIDAGLLTRHSASWINWFTIPTGKNIYTRLMHLDENVPRPYFTGFMFKNRVSQAIADFIFQRILGYTNHFERIVNIEPIHRDERQEPSRLVVLPVNLLYGEQGLIRTMEAIPGNDLKPCLIWSADAVEQPDLARKTILEFDSIESMNAHLRANRL